jgi:peptide/nickel transport system substrate-binding protein
MEWTPQQRLTFVPNPEWTGPAPAYSEVRGVIILEPKAAELAFEAGEVSCTEITADAVARYTESPPPNSALHVAGSLQYMWMGMNTEHPKLSDIRVRQAIQHAVDVDSVIAGAYAGTTEKSYGIVCPGLIGHRTASKYSYDPEKAKALLAEAGVSGLELELKTLNVQERLLAAQIIQANLAAVGITATVIPVESGPFWEMGSEEAGEQWKELQLWLMRYGTNPDPYECTQWFRRDQIGVWNWERWSDDEYEALYLKGLSESDPVVRDGIYKRMQEIMEDTGAYVWINHESETFAYSTDISVDIYPSGEMDLRDFKPA